MIGDRMKKLRLKKGLSMDEMANIIGVSSSSVISRYENKQTNPKEKYIIKYAEYFGVSVDWIKYGELKDYIYKVLINKDKTVQKKLNNMEIIYNNYPNDISKLNDARIEYLNSCIPYRTASQLIEEEWDGENYPSEEEIFHLYSHLPMGQDLLDYMEIILSQLNEFMINLHYHCMTDNLTESLEKSLRKFINNLDEAYSNGSRIANNLFKNRKNYKHRDEEN